MAKKKPAPGGNLGTGYKSDLSTANHASDLAENQSALNDRMKAHFANGGLDLRPARAAPAVASAPTVGLLCASDIQPEKICWIWRGWLAAGKMHILGGAPGTGKTTLAVSFAAIVSTGGRWPDGTSSPPGNVIIWSGEDDPADTLVPRAVLAGADLNRVYFVGDTEEGGIARSFDPSRDIAALNQRMTEIGDVRLLIVDPIVSAISGDSHKNAETRRDLQPLADLAADARCALLGITHFSKGTGGREPLERITGSLAFGALPRIVMVAAKKQNGDARILARAKSNIGPDDGGFEYSFNQDHLPANPAIRATAVQWGLAITGTARDIVAMADEIADGGDGGALDEAKQFLSGFLGDSPQPVKAIRAESNDAGHSWATIQRAKKALNVHANKTGMSGGWEWSLARRCSKKHEDVQQNSVSTFGKFEHLRHRSDDPEGIV